MFINIDYNKRQQKARLHLAKPNKQIISHISEKFRDDLIVKLGDINELNFSIPHSIDGEENPHVDLIKEKMLIKLTLGSYKEWFVVDGIEEDGDDTDIFNVKCFSLGYELKGNRIPNFTRDAVNGTEALEDILEDSAWSIGVVDEIFNQMARSFDESSTNSLGLIVEAGKSFGALIVWDTENRKVSFKDMKTNGRFRGMTVNYGKFLRSIKRSRTTDELTTRLYIYGNEGLSINGVNPTGMDYIEDFSYFMYPFERDANKNVVQSSHFMSDELCHAILDHNALIADNSEMLKQWIEERNGKESLLVSLETDLMQLEMELEIIMNLLDMAKQSEDESLIEQRKSERDLKLEEVAQKRLEINAMENEIENLERQIIQVQDDISKEANFTPQLLDELKLYIIKNDWIDDRYTDAQELFDDGVKRFEEIRQPKVVLDVSIDNLMNVIEEQYYWDKIVLGDLIKVKYPQMKIEYMAKIIEIHYDLENSEISIKIANHKDFLNETEKLVQLLYSNASASSILQNNKYKWDKVNAIENEVNAILQGEWDANKNKITAGVNNSIEVGNRGVIIRNPDFPQEVVIMQSGIIALSKDGGETWKTAIKPDGIVAERLIGQIIAGQNLIITNNAGSFTFDNNGFRVKASAFVIESGSNPNDNLLDKFIDSSTFYEKFADDNIITPYEKKMLKIEWEKIVNKYDSISNRLSRFYEDAGTSIQDVNDFHTSYLDLYNYLFVQLHGDKPLLADTNMAFATNVNRSIFDQRFRNYYSLETSVEEQLSLRAKDLADEAKTIADEAKRNIEEVMDDVVWKIELHSTNGLTFRNNNINTTIIARVYRGMEDITSTLPVSSFIWEKKDKDGVIDETWTNNHRNVGNTIIITHQDVNQKATFRCDIKIEK
ncbi:hypothetical protein PQE75_gp217 [Bacillus phage vB_BcoS-136]|uniref:Uncharacterized protein n=1 Tax=Bacillus phage vB_BcoS-136 TaxID=2419619 RepID=A0A3G3BVH4_9CAUD|nr:hypothetical protein PQE75_gp217 [Bacillus phage vB_BcoS-136]AYP68262.1 hypothetical protein vBBcoS136_00147 [Bacillus phage vB_BcoS-136]